MKADRSLEIIPVDVQGILNGTVADIPLKNEDVLFIPTQTELRNLRTLTITGEVLSPGEYEYADNTTIEDLIIQAGGLKDEASTARVDVSRRIIDTKSKNKTKEIAKSFTFSLKDGLVIDGERGFLLEPYDVVHVRRSPGFHTPRSVMVEGEVNFDGNFTLEKKNQRLSDLIAAAGGITDDAYIKGARLMRQMSDDERSRMQTILNMARAQEDDKDTIMIDQLALEETYPVGIHLDKALENPGGSYDITLREGDRLIIPEYNGTVRISGNVMFPNTVAYEEGKNYKYFVNQAGGFGNRAKKSKTYIVYQNGTVSQVGHGTKVEPGCEIVVPTKAKRNAMGLTQWLSVGTSLTSIAAMVATLANALK
jgi:protein involved in polysaccharide export with SLBB domain